MATSAGQHDEDADGDGALEAAGRGCRGLGARCGPRRHHVRPEPALRACSSRCTELPVTCRQAGKTVNPPFDTRVPGFTGHADSALQCRLASAKLRSTEKSRPRKSVSRKRSIPAGEFRPDGRDLGSAGRASLSQLLVGRGDPVEQISQQALLAGLQDGNGRGGSLSSSRTLAATRSPSALSTTVRTRRSVGCGSRRAKPRCSRASTTAVM